MASRMNGAMRGQRKHKIEADLKKGGNKGGRERTKSERNES